MCVYSIVNPFILSRDYGLIIVINLRFSFFFSFCESMLEMILSSITAGIGNWPRKLFRRVFNCIFFLLSSSMCSSFQLIFTRFFWIVHWRQSVNSKHSHLQTKQMLFNIIYSLVKLILWINYKKNATFSDMWMYYNWVCNSFCHLVGCIHSDDILMTKQTNRITHSFSILFFSQFPNQVGRFRYTNHKSSKWSVKPAKRKTKKIIKNRTNQQKLKNKKRRCFKHSYWS